MALATLGNNDLIVRNGGDSSALVPKNVTNFQCTQLGCIGLY